MSLELGTSEEMLLPRTERPKDHDACRIGRALVEELIRQSGPELTLVNFTDGQLTVSGIIDVWTLVKAISLSSH